MSGLLELREVYVNFGAARGFFGRRTPPVQALRGIDLDVIQGEVLAVVGESGCGKSTLARVLVQAIQPDRGSARFENVELRSLPPRARRQYGRQIQMVFQDPFASLDPRRSIGASVGEPLRIQGHAGGAALRARVAEALAAVGIDGAAMDRLPDAFSGGQRQRICIARAIIGRPRLLVADEALSALDPTLRARMVALLRKLRADLGLSCVFISHDLDTVRHLADRVAVMYLGRIVELGTTREVLTHPRHPYTQALLAAMPVPDPVYERTRPHPVLAGETPSAVRPPPGCAFHPRCARATVECRETLPELHGGDPAHQTACHHPL